MLNYLCMCTRPDISVAVSIHSRFLENPGKQHWKAAKRVLRYLKGTKNYGLNISPKDSNLSCFSDADWAGNVDNRKSTSGYCVLYGGALVSWKSKLQNCVSLSTMEFEYYALSLAAQEVVWFIHKFGYMN